MPNRFDTLSERLAAAWKPYKEPKTARAFRCGCGRPVFFRNSQCLACGSALGYDPERGTLLSLLPADREGLLWRAGADAGNGPVYRRCANFNTMAACNWLIADAGEGTPTYCRACRLNRTIPDLSNAEHAKMWGFVEFNKRRLVSQLLGLGLPVASKVDEDPERGVAFDFLAPLPGGPPVMTGHASGLITINIEEARSSTREQVRELMGEPYRTVLGHFRHEIGHYYWDRLVQGTDWLEAFRALFGDERQDYAASLKANYENGPPADWPLRFISSYASTHPWEDWAETWAHYLHMVDTVDTALSIGIDADDIELDTEPWGRDALWRPDAPNAEACLGFLNAWVEIAAAVNEMARSMGERDFYPFVMSRPVVAKLQFIYLVASGRTLQETM